MDKLKLYEFEVKGAGDNYRLYLENYTQEAAMTAAKGIAGNGRAVALVSRRVGCINDRLPLGFHDKVARRFKIIRNKHWGGQGGTKK